MLLKSWMRPAREGCQPRKRAASSLKPHRSIVDVLTDAGVEVIVDADRSRDDLTYKLDVSADGRHVRAIMGLGITEPRVEIAG